MPCRRITSRDVATIPQPGYNLAESIQFSPDDTLLTYLRPTNPLMIRQLYAYELRTEREFLYAALDETDDITDEHRSREEKLRREVGVFCLSDREKIDCLSMEDFADIETRERERNSKSDKDQDECEMYRMLLLQRQRLLITGITRYQWAKEKVRSLMLVPIGSDLYIQEKNQLRLLVYGSHQTPILEPKLSPDGSLVAYVRDCELYCISTDASSWPPHARQLTFDARGYANKTNGLADFIAQEEMERNDGFWWSDDSRFIAFTQVDESNVPVFRISHSGSDEPDQVEQRSLTAHNSIFDPSRVKNIDIRSPVRRTYE